MLSNLVYRYRRLVWIASAHILF